MRTIFKYPIRLGRFTLDIHEGAEILTAQVQNCSFFLWARVDESRPKTTRRFALVGTGEDLEDAAQWNYVATFHDGPLVWHLLAQ